MENIKEEKPENEVVKEPRQIGFEILRIIAMFLICCVHLLNYGGIMENAQNQLWLKLLYAIFTVSVNVFVLISGYFLVKSKITFKKILKLWLQVAFYSILFYLIATLLLPAQTGRSFRLKDFILSFFPVINNKYWFFTAYFLLYLISPFLNMILSNSSKKQLIFLLVGLNFLNVIFYLKTGIINIISFNGGYSLAWFIVLYLTAGYLRLYPLKVKKYVYLITYLLSTIVTWMLGYFMSRGLGYTSIFVLISSISIFMLFSNITCSNVKLNKVISFISGCTFGIYLLQESYIKPYIYFNILCVQNVYGSSISVLYVIAFALALMIFGFITEIVRKVIFLGFDLLQRKKNKTT